MESDTAERKAGLPERPENSVRTGRTGLNRCVLCGGVVALRDLAKRTNTSRSAAICRARGEGRRRNPMSGVVGGFQFGVLLSEGGCGVTWAADGIGGIWR